MMIFIIAILLILSFHLPLHAQPVLPPVQCQELDGSPSVIPCNTIRFTNGSMTDQGGGIVDVNTGSQAGTQSDSFATHNTPSGTDPVADDATDTLNWAAGLNISITGNSTTDTITIEAGVLDLELSSLTGILDNEMLVGTGSGAGSYIALPICNQTTERWHWNGTAISCVTDQNTGGGGSALETQVSGVSQSTNTTTYDFDGNDFFLSESPADDFDISLVSSVHRDGEIKDGDLVDFDDTGDDYVASNLDDAMTEVGEAVFGATGIPFNQLTGTVDRIGTTELNDGASTPVDGYFMRVDTPTTQIRYDTVADSATALRPSLLPIALTTDTSGNYVGTLSCGNGVTGCVAGAEGATPTISGLLGTTDGVGATSSASGLEFLVNGGVGLLQGCTDGQIPKWTEASSVWSCAADSGGAGSGAFSDASDPIVQNTTTKDVHLGDGVSGLTGKLEVGGDADQPQVVIQGHSTQTDDVLIIANNAGTEVYTVSDAGAVVASGGVTAGSPGTVASTGDIALANASSICARNAGDTADFCIDFTASDTIEFSNTTFVTDNFGILFGGIGGAPSCGAGQYKIYADGVTDNELKKCENGVVSTLDTVFAGLSGTTPSLNFNDVDNTGDPEGQLVLECATPDDCSIDFDVFSGSASLFTSMQISTDGAGATSVRMGDPDGGNEVVVQEDGTLVVDNLGIEFLESDTNPTCAAGDYAIYADLSETTLKKCLNGTLSDLDTTGSSPTFDTIGTGTNTTATMTVGTGGTLTTSGSGTIVATTAAALAANGSNCSAGQFAAGVDASGAAEGCTDVLTETELDTEAELESQLTDVTDVLTNNDTLLDSIAIPAGAISADGTQCADPAEVTIGTWGKTYSVICADNDASTMTMTIPAMPDAWNAGTVTVEAQYIQDGVDTSALNMDVAGRCTGAGETPAAYGTEVAIDDAAVTGNDAVDFTTSGAVTLAGTCAAGDMVQLQVQVDATGTTTAMATMNFVGFKVEYTKNLTGD